jgi:hypothetical protein
MKRCIHKAHKTGLIGEDEKHNLLYINYLKFKQALRANGAYTTIFETKSIGKLIKNA